MSVVGENTTWVSWLAFLGTAAVLLAAAPFLIRLLRRIDAAERKGSSEHRQRVQDLPEDLRPRRAPLSFVATGLFAALAGGFIVGQIVGSPGFYIGALIVIAPFYWRLTRIREEMRETALARGLSLKHAMVPDDHDRLMMNLRVVYGIRRPPS